MDATVRQQLADDLSVAERDRRPLEPLTGTHPTLDVVDAYEIQLLNVRRRVAEGARVRGHKVGLSSLAMQRMMGVDEPDYGHLLDDMFVLEATSVPAGRYCQPRVELEVGIVLGAPLRGPGCTIADVVRAVDYVVPALELIDSRIEGWRIGLVDTIADNASSAGVVLGASPKRLADLRDIRLLGALLWRNGEIVETGAAGAVLGNPLSAVAWLANKVHGFGVSLEAGQVVLPGSCTRAVDVGPGDHIRAEVAELGSVSVSFT